MKCRPYCVVGLGQHAIQQVIPAIERVGGNIVSTVSRNKKIKNIKNFQTLDESLDYHCKNDVIFYLSSPYTVHGSQAVQVTKNNHDLFIEKPAFVKKSELLSFCETHNNNNFFVECFMYRYSRMYTELKNFYKKNYDNISEIILNFTIPEFPTTSFRNYINIYSVILNDIGCYPISLLIDLKIPIKEIINKGEFTLIKEENIIVIKMKDINTNTVIKFKIGLCPNYVNEAILVTGNKKFIFNLVFNGRKIEKNIYQDNNKKIKSFIDHNSFEKMLTYPKSHWLRTSKTRLDNIFKVCDIMHIFDKEIILK
tara:strand:- start:16285 stop:17214 length:930 start_codon:yes stop_codon:yes gene_type:complete